MRTKNPIRNCADISAFAAIPSRNECRHLVNAYVKSDRFGLRAGDSSRAAGHSESAGINRDVVADERALQERRAARVAPKIDLTSRRVNSTAKTFLPKST